MQARVSAAALRTAHSLLSNSSWTVDIRTGSCEDVTAPGTCITVNNQEMGRDDPGYYMWSMILHLLLQCACIPMYHESNISIPNANLMSSSTDTRLYSIPCCTCQKKFTKEQCIESAQADSHSKWTRTLCTQWETVEVLRQIRRTILTLPSQNRRVWACCQLISAGISNQHTNNILVEYALTCAVFFWNLFLQFRNLISNSSARNNWW